MNDKPIILFDVKEKILVPVNLGIFSLSQFLSEKKLNKKYSGCLVLLSDGVVKEIKKVSIVGYYGNSFWSKLFSILNSTHNISVCFEELEINIEELSAKAKEFLVNDLASEDPSMPQQNPETLFDNNFASTKELYLAFKLPEVEDCLDVMV